MPELAGDILERVSRCYPIGRGVAERIIARSTLYKQLERAVTRRHHFVAAPLEDMLKLKKHLKGFINGGNGWQGSNYKPGTSTRIYHRVSLLAGVEVCDCFMFL